MESTVFFIYDSKLDKQIGFVSTASEAVRVVLAGEGRYSYVEVSDREINGLEQICYENLFE